MQESIGILSVLLEAPLAVKGIVIILLLMSLLSWAIMLQKIVIIKKIKQNIAKAGILLNDAKYDYKTLKGILSSQENNIYHDAFIMGEYFLKGSDYYFIQEKIHEFLQQNLKPIQSKMSLLAVIASSSPFIGLLGTVLGIINSFHSIGLTGSASLNVVAPGIAEALYVTGIGLAVAIPALIGYNLINSSVDSVDEVLVQNSNDVLFRLLVNHEKSKEKREKKPSERQVADTQKPKKTKSTRTTKASKLSSNEDDEELF